MLNNLSEQQLLDRIHTLEQALQPPPPGVQPIAEEITHANRQLLQRLRAELQNRNRIHVAPPPPPLKPQKKPEITTTQTGYIVADKTFKYSDYQDAITCYNAACAYANQQPTTNNQQPTTNNQQPTTSRTIHAGNQQPVNSQQPMSATIQADHATNPHNPTVTITWADGYTYTGDETAIRGRFVTTLRDTLSLRLVQKGRFAAMWRWSSPWRAAGFYQALTHLCGGTPPTLKDLDIKRPNDLTITVFAHIVEKASQI